jgi:hypothetical protein
VASASLSVRFDRKESFMIDRYSRDRLAELLRHLVCGQMTNDDFADRASNVAYGSEDQAVRVIYESADGLYGDLSTYRLRGTERVSDEVRRQFAIAAMFLYSDREYEWPEFSEWSSLGDFVRLICAALAFPTGLALLVGAFAFASSGSLIAAVVLLLASASCFGGIAWLYFQSQAAERREYQAWCERQNRFGDWDVWPFLRQADFDAQRPFPRLLTGKARTASN